MPFDRTLLPDPVTYFENRGLNLKGPRPAKWKTTTCNFHGGSDSMRVNVALDELKKSLLHQAFSGVL